MDDYQREMQREMQSERDEEMLDFEMEHKRKMGLESIDMELDTNYSDLSPQELAELRFKKIQELDMDLEKERRKIQMEMEYDRHIEEMREDMEEMWEEMRDSMFEDDDYPY